MSRFTLVLIIYILSLISIYADVLEPISAYGYQFKVGGGNNDIIYRYSAADSSNENPRGYVYYQNYQMNSLPITSLSVNASGNVSFQQGGLTFNCAPLAINGNPAVTQCNPSNYVYSAYSVTSEGVYYVNNSTSTGTLSFISTCSSSNCSNKMPKLPNAYPSQITGLIVAKDFVFISSENDGLYVYSDNPAFTAMKVNDATSDISNMYYDAYQNQLYLESSGNYYQCNMGSTANSTSEVSCSQLSSSTVSSICTAFSTIAEMSSDSTTFTQGFYQYNEDNISGSYDGDSFGPSLNATPLYVGSINTARSIPDICANNTAFLQQRVIDTARYITTLKFNYCHHHMPYAEAPSSQQSGNGSGKYCSGNKNIYPDTVTNDKVVRWNYVEENAGTVTYTTNTNGMTATSSVSASASNLQSLISASEANWQSEGMWYGVDCSDFTSLVYGFALGNLFSTDVSEQAGQQLSLSGNSELIVTSVAQHPRYDAFGTFLCTNGEIAQSGVCASGNLISTWLSADKNNKAITPDILSELQPGDILYIAADEGSALVTHTIIWSGLKIGSGTSDIPASLIAPNGICSPKSDWGPVAGDWVIIDSTYQGPDLRKYMPGCFYGPSVWAVKRIINIGASNNQYPYPSINNVLLGY